MTLEIGDSFKYYNSTYAFNYISTILYLFDDRIITEMDAEVYTIQQRIDNLKWWLIHTEKNWQDEKFLLLDQRIWRG